MSDKLSDKMPELPLPVADVIVFDPIHQMTRLEQAHGEYFTEAQLQAYAEAYAQQWREDAARLDWLEADEDRAVYFGTEGKWYCQEGPYGVNGIWSGDSMRAAIDAARAAREGRG